MNIPDDAIIAREKLTQYLLVPRRRNDKSKFLAQGGFTLKNPDDLESAIRQLIAQVEAAEDGSNEYGDYYRVEGELVGVNGIKLGVVTVGIARIDENDTFRFVTLKPGRKALE